MADINKSKHKPRCIGFIMDGNRRYAKKHSMKTIGGHSAGYEKLKEILKWIKETSIKHVIVYAFSTENWNRSSEEVNALLSLLRMALGDKMNELTEQGVKLRFIGDLSRFDETFQNQMKDAEEKTRNNSNLTLYIALSYGGRAEIVNAVKEISRLSSEQIKKLDEESFRKYLWTGDMPDPDLIVRTGAEIRLSNFLPYQSVYSELFFTKTLWPEFSKEEFEQILQKFDGRKINRGK